ncbi:MAG: tRNA (adenosine(37)-N6)-threonylcarbamoyltransferase complex ATPase subunit type 1 TsaE [Pseudomonadales bacterium]
MIHLEDEQATATFGQRLVRALGGRGAVHISGELGAGKTTLCRAMIKELGHQGAVKSPTFTIVEPYELSGRRIFHIDLYRLTDANELNYLAIDEYYGDDCLCLVEWPERAAGQLPDHDVDVRLEGTALSGSGVKTATARSVSLKGSSQLGEKVCLELAQDYKHQGS